MEVAVRAGDVLGGKYRIERQLGAGGMGVVVLATHLELDERVAIKILLPDAATVADTTLPVDASSATDTLAEPNDIGGAAPPRACDCDLRARHGDASWSVLALANVLARRRNRSERSEA